MISLHLIQDNDYYKLRIFIKLKFFYPLINFRDKKNRFLQLYVLQGVR